METFDIEILAMLNALESDLDDVIEDEEDEDGWDLFGWDGPDEN
jgi:hypothetical protein